MNGRFCLRPPAPCLRRDMLRMGRRPLFGQRAGSKNPHPAVEGMNGRQRRIGFTHGRIGWNADSDA